jgi:hypothetical protein
LIRIASEADNLALAGIELPGNQFPVYKKGCHPTFLKHISDMIPLSQSGQVTVFAVNRLTWSRNHRQHKVGSRLRRKAISYRHIGSVQDRPHLAVSS